MAGSDRWGPLRDTLAYSTEGRDMYDHKVTFNFDYSDVSVGVREARNIMADFRKQIANEMKGIKSSNGFIFADSDFKNYGEMTINIMPDKAMARDMYIIGKETSTEAKATMKKYIGSRVDTGRMKGSVYGRTEKNGDMVTSTAGWVDLWYRYFGYQEEGTSRVSPMHSVLRTYMEIAPQVQKTVSWYLRNAVKGKGFK